jgi:uncharacterized protein YegP (UPF0339 family)
MANRFELVVDHDKTFFELKDKDGHTLLRSLGSASKIMTQNEIQHLRKALRDRSHLVAHQGKDGSWFVVVKEDNGTVLARSPHVPDDPALQTLIDHVMEIFASAPIIDKTKRQQQTH